MPVVAVPGLGNVQFPQGMDPEQMGQVIGEHLSKPKGMVQKGNIDLNNRPVIPTPGKPGYYSSELSFSRGTDDGEVLVPRIVKGKMLSEDQAWDHYIKTGEHMGIFDTPENADAYAESVHNRPQAPRNRTNMPLYVYPANRSSKPQ